MFLRTEGAAHEESGEGECCELHIGGFVCLLFWIRKNDFVD